MKKRPLRILSIDDDLSCQLAAARFLTFVGGHIVEVAENGREGIKKAATLKPDIILLDMSMPDMNGLEVMEALSSGPATRHIPVIVITGASLSDTELDSLKVKRNFMFLEQKPAKFNMILEKIEEIAISGIIITETRETILSDSHEPA